MHTRSAAAANAAVLMAVADQKVIRRAARSKAQTFAAVFVCVGLTPMGFRPWWAPVMRSVEPMNDRTDFRSML